MSELFRFRFLFFRVLVFVVYSDASLIEDFAVHTAGRNTFVLKYINTNNTYPLPYLASSKMASTARPNSSFEYLAPDRVMERNTLIEDAPQISIRRAPPQQIKRPTVVSPLSDDFPTPKANIVFDNPMESVPVPPSPASSDTQSDGSSLFSKRSSSSEFDEMYDITESESEGDVPIKLSNSMKRRMAQRTSKCPSLEIPSPSEWPTIDK